ncbi:hypothetical protein CR513_52966, partial [Mucuna pruriens]
MKSEERQKAWQSKLQKFNHIDVRYHWICDALDVKLLELAKVHIDDNDADMMTKIFVDDNIYNHIANEIHVMTLWEKIEYMYALKRGNNKLFLLNSIVSLKFKEDTSLSNHLNEFQGIIDQMLDMGIKFEDEILGLLLLNSLPES